jgi:hypothetical protein
MIATHRAALEAAGARSVTILDTPFGFQENVEQLTEKLTDFFRTSLAVGVEVAGLRTPGAPPVVRERAIAAVRTAAAVFAGPGSPGYAMRVWSGSGIDDALRSVIAGGGSVILASAAAVTAGVRALPVYEIYKVGTDPHWIEGLDLTSAFGLPMVVVPHWNNAEGQNHDTSRCYVGERRLRLLERSLDVGILGVDEHTAATLDFGAGVLTVSGIGSVTLRGARTVTLASGERIDLDEVAAALSGPASASEGPGPVADPAPYSSFDAALAARDLDAALGILLAEEAAAAEDPARRGTLRSMLAGLAGAAEDGMIDPRARVAGFVELLLGLRTAARDARRFDEADRIRDGLALLGIEVRDTRDGVEWDLAGAQNPRS